MADKSNITRVEALNATKAGGEAQRAGKAITSCPHKADGNPADRFLATHWVKGYNVADRATA